MNFKGAAKRLDDIDLPKLGATIGVGEDELHAFIDVETRGSGFDEQGRPRILFERHIFWRYLTPAERKKAGSLANPKPGGYGKESDQYDKLIAAMKVNKNAAMYACSWGLGQIMGFNHALAGYPTVDAMVKDFMEDEENHLRAAVKFIVAARLDDNLRAHDWHGFAEGYNGPKQEINNYEGKLRDAYAKWKRIKDTPLTITVEPEPEPAPEPEPTPEPAEVSGGLKKWVFGAAILAALAAGATKYLGVW
jgi:hypothetical protein